MYISTKQAAEKWGISERRVRVLCGEGKIVGAFQVGRGWNIPSNAKKPIDGRNKNQEDIVAAVFEKKELLEHKRPLTVGEVEKLNDQFLVEYTYNSNAIEGNTLTLRETDMVLKGMTIDRKPLKEHLEAIGHRDAFNYICDLIKENVKLNEERIKQIHSLVLVDRPQDKGVYRKIPVQIMGALVDPCQPYLIQENMERLLLDYENSNENFIKNVALFHLKFEGIHPFIDGNGRTGRLLVNMELIKAGFPPIDIKFTDRARYYSAFDAYFGQNDESVMEKLFAEYLLERVETYLNILSR